MLIIMDYISHLVDYIKPILKEYGMKKKGLNRFLEDSHIIKIFNIQKSLYSKKIYLNIGIKIKELDKNPSYLFPGCGISLRLDNLIKEEYLDFENDMPLNKKVKSITELLESDPYGFFSLSGEKEFLHQFVKQHPELEYSTFKIYKEYLNV